MQRPDQRLAPILDGSARHSLSLSGRGRTFAEKEMGNIWQNGYRHISRVYVLFYTAGFSTQLPGSHRSRIRTLDT